jgi:dihydropyrimidine dehydrogenase (NADP+)
VKTPDHKIESNSVVKKVGGGGQIKLHGHVVVLGIGDTALDCARSAFRLGAERVTVAFRRGFSDLRANDEIFDPARMEGINFVPYSSPLEYKVSEDGSKVKSVTFDKNLP